MKNLDVPIRNMGHHEHSNILVSGRHISHNLEQEHLNVSFRSGGHNSSVSPQSCVPCGSTYFAALIPTENLVPFKDQDKMPSQHTAPIFGSLKGNTFVLNNNHVTSAGHLFSCASEHNEQFSADNNCSTFVRNGDVSTRHSVPWTSKPFSTQTDMNRRKNMLHDRTKFFQKTNPVLLEDETFEEAFLQNESVAKNDSLAKGNRHTEMGYASDKEPVSLYIWIIKPVPGTHSICVEGKRDLSATGTSSFWQSGIITHRINEKVVVSNTGSVYRLEGNMEVMDAISTGLSYKTAEAFWLGFPRNWEQVIVDHFRDVETKRASLELLDSDEEIAIIEQLSDGDDNYLESGHYCFNKTDFLGSGHHGSNAADFLESRQHKGSNEPNFRELVHQPSTSHINKYVTSPVNALEGSKSVLERSPSEVSIVENDSMSHIIKKLAQKKANKTERNQGRGKCTEMDNWIIKPLPNGQGIHLLGIKSDGALWHTSAIEKRISKRKLQSTSGAIYKLKGNMDKLLALDYDLPQEIIKQFYNGFPKEWQELVQAYLSKCSLAKKKSSLKGLSAHKAKQLNANNNSKRKSKQSDNKCRVQKGSASRKASMEKKSKKCVEKTTSVVNETVKLAFKSTCKTEILEPRNIVLTPYGELVDLKTLGHSRSGRLIKPPLHWWARQRLSIEGESVVVREPTISSSNFIKEFEDGYKHSSHKIKTWSNLQKKDRDYSRFDEMSSTKSYVSTANNLQPNKATETFLQKSDDDLLPDVEKEIKLILEKAKQNRSGRPKQKTCYNEVKGHRVKKDYQGEKKNDSYDLDTTSDTELGNANAPINCENIVYKQHGKGRSRKQDTIENNADVLKKYGKEKRSNDQCVIDKSTALDSQVQNNNEHVKFTRNVIQLRKGSSGRQETNKNTKDVKKDGEGQIMNGQCDLNKFLDSGSQFNNINVHCAKNVVDKRKIRNIRQNTNETKAVVADQENIVSSSTLVGESCNTEKNEERDNYVSTQNIKLGRCRVLVEKLVDTCVDDVPLKRQTRSCLRNKNLSSDHKKLDNRNADNESNCSTKNKSNRRINRSSQKQKHKEHLKQPEVVPTVFTENLAPEYHWTKEEQESLQKACKHICPSNPDYWMNVAEQVKTKSVEACKEFFYKNKDKPKEKLKKPKKKNIEEKPKVTCLTANVGTLKRKQQLRDLITQHSENCSGDLFDSTPFKAKKKKIPNLGGIGDDAIFEEIAIKQGKSRLETPVATTKHNYTKAVRPIASCKKTPTSNIYLNETYDSRDADAYVHRILKSRIQSRRQKMPVEKTKPIRKITATVTSTQQKLFNEILQKKKDTSENDKDSDQDSDFYFDDETDNTDFS